MYVPHEVGWHKGKKASRLKSLVKARAGELQVPLHEVAPFYVSRLWDWAMIEARDGDLTDYTPAELAKAMGFTAGPPAVLVASLQDAGFIVQKADRMVISNWGKKGRAGAAFTQLDRLRKQNRERQRRHRDRKRARETCG